MGFRFQRFYIHYFYYGNTVGSAYWSNTRQISDGDVTCLSILGFSRHLRFWGFISTAFWGKIAALALLMKGRCGFSFMNCSNSLAFKMASHLPCTLASITFPGNSEVPSEWNRLLLEVRTRKLKRLSNHFSVLSFKFSFSYRYWRVFP